MTASAFNLDILNRLFDAENVSAALEAMYDCCLNIGGDKFSYHPEVMFEGVASARSEVYGVGFPEDWVAAYTGKGNQMTDPLPDLVMRKGRPMMWRDALSDAKLSPAQQAYIVEARKFGLISGAGFPLWGPQGANAFVAIGFPDPEFVMPAEMLSSVHVVLLAGHQKIHELTASTATRSVLSSRECEVLTWVGKGKSSTDVAAILAISPETVATYMRRIYAKLNCHDRIGAVIKALRLGLIRV